MQIRETQHVLRSLLRGMPHIVLGGVPRERAGEQRLASAKSIDAARAGRSALLRAVSGHVLSCATLIGTYRR